MTTIFSTATSGMQHAQRVLDVVGHNVANVNSEAFKRVRPVAQGAPEVAAGAGRLGVAQTTLDRVLDVAAIRSTGDPMHVALQDDAYLRVRDTDGTVAYTRFGALSADGAGNVVAFGGRLLEPPIQLEPGMTSPTVEPDGTVNALDAAGERQEVGRLQLARFANPAGLESIGDGLYRPTVNSGEPAVGAPGEGGFAELFVGGLESSNVDLAEEFTTMLIAQRAYQASVKSFQVGDQMLAVATDLTQ